MDLPVHLVEAPALYTGARWRLAAAVIAVLIHVLPMALLWRCSDASRDAGAVLPPLQVSLHDRGVPAAPSIPFEIRPPAPTLDIATPDLRIEPDPPPMRAADAVGAASSTIPRAAAARACRPYRWLLAISSAIESALKGRAPGQHRDRRGTAIVRVEVERGGRVLDARLIRSSGHPHLDTEALSVMRRFDRFAALTPGECVGYDVIVVDQPVRFGR